MRRIIPLLVSSLLFLSTAAPAPGPASLAAAAPAAPTEIPPPAHAGRVEVAAEPPAGLAAAEGPAGRALAAGDWYVGATPPNLDPAKPVLVFVHGKGGSAAVWWGPTAYHGTNDMYAYAYHHGYRTAFVDLAPEGTMWDNGALLSTLLGAITAHFGVSRVVIVAHSKGGVDANAASAHYGAVGKIQRVITLGTPHRGTPLADLAYSSWASWLAEVLGQRTDAAYVMQTGYMDYFRSVTDGRDPGVAYATVSGYKCGPLFTALWLGCVYIAGEDDGVVPVWSAQKPGALHLQTGYWDHDEIRMGSRVWSTIAPQLTASGQPAAAGRIHAGLAAPGNLILRGGGLGPGAQADAFPIERGVKAAAFHVLASHPEVQVSLVAPDGTRHPVKLTQQVPDGEVFAGAWLGTVEVEGPAPGAWRLAAGGPEGSAYLLIAALEGGVTAVLDRGSQVSAPGSHRTLTVAVQGAAVAESRASLTLSGRAGVIADGIALSPGPGGHRVSVPVPRDPGVYTVTAAVTGTLPDGSAFERTVVSSFAVFPDGD